MYSTLHTLYIYIALSVCINIYSTYKAIYTYNVICPLCLVCSICVVANPLTTIHNSQWGKMSWRKQKSLEIIEWRGKKKHGQLQQNLIYFIVGLRLWRRPQLEEYNIFIISNQLCDSRHRDCNSPFRVNSCFHISIFHILTHTLSLSYTHTETNTRTLYPILCCCCCCFFFFIRFGFSLFVSLFSLILDSFRTSLRESMWESCHFNFKSQMLMPFCQCQNVNALFGHVFFL